MLVSAYTQKSWRNKLVVLVLMIMLIAAALLMSFGQLLAPTALTSSPRLPDFGKLPLSFEPNAGQTDPLVRFMVRASGATLYFMPSEVVLTLKGSGEEENKKEVKRRGRPLAASESRSAPSTVVRIQYVGANPSSKMDGGASLPGKVNYFIGNDPSKWHTDLPTYSGVTYNGLYPGVDLSYEGTGGSLKGTYTLAPRADPSLIRWRYEGAQSVSVDAEGNLQVTFTNSKLRTQNSKLTEQAPVAWQEIWGHRVQVKVAYKVEVDCDNGNMDLVGFAVSSYDKAYPLTIDPILTYSTYLGGWNNDAGRSVAVDQEGNAYITGYTFSINFPTQSPYQPTLRGNEDVFITKLDPTGSALVYSTYLGGSGTEEGMGIAVDEAGNAYIAGGTGSTNFPTRNSYQPKNAGDADAFLAKLDAKGSGLVYSTYLGGSGRDVGDGISVGATGNVYLYGDTTSVDFPTLNAYQTNNAGYYDTFVTKFNANGSGLFYSTYLGGVHYDFPKDITVDGTGSAYIVGNTRSPNFPVQNPYQPTLMGDEDAFVTKLDPTGSALVYSTFLGGDDIDWGWGIGVDAQDNAYVAGYTGSINFPVANAYQPSSAGGFDAFLTRFNAGGSALIYSTYLGGNSDDYGHGVAEDQVGNVYVAGTTYSTNFPVVNPIQPTYAGTQDIFVTKFNATASALVYSTYLGGSSIDALWGIALDGSGSAYITGYTHSNNFPTVNAYQWQNMGFADGFVAKILDQPAGTLTPTPAPTTTSTSPTLPTPTYTPTYAPTHTSTITPTPTQTPTALISTPTASATAGTCIMPFMDVQPTDYFYTAIHYLYCHEAISGYADNTFRPYNTTTRGQLCKIVTLAEGWIIYTPPIPTFSDIPPNHPFYQYVETAYHQGIISGYQDGTFRSGNDVTRGQLCKVIVLAEQWSIYTPPTPTFLDVSTMHPFYPYIETTYSHLIISGYVDETFRPDNPATRGQICKIVYNAIIQP